MIAKDRSARIGETSFFTPHLQAVFPESCFLGFPLDNWICEIMPVQINYHLVALKFEQLEVKRALMESSSIVSHPRGILFTSRKCINA